MNSKRNVRFLGYRLVAYSSLAAVLALSAVMALFGMANAADPPTQPLDLIYRTESPQQYSVLLEGTGMSQVTSGTLSNITVDGSGIVKAYLIWAGLGTDPDGVSFRRDDEAPMLISPTPDLTWNTTFNNPTGQKTWGCCGDELSAYAADITDLNIVVTGTYSYTLSDMDLSVDNWGYSLIVVYEDPSLTVTRHIMIKLGNDGLFFGWGDQTNPSLLGPNSDVQCIAVPPVDYDRQARFDFVIGGIKDDFRPNGIWGLTGNEPYIDFGGGGCRWNQSVGLINLPANPPNSPAFTGIGVEVDGPLDGDKTGNGIDWPFSDASGFEWDEYLLENIAFLAGREWVCIQIESANRPELAPSGTFQLGASIGFLGFVASVDEPIPEPGSLAVEANASYEWVYTVTNPDTGNPDQPNLEGIRLVAGPFVEVTCPQATLSVGEDMACSAVSSDLAYYGSAAWAIGVPVGGGTAVVDFVFPD